MRMLSMKVHPADEAKKKSYFRLMEEAARAYLEHSLKILGLTREAFRDYFFHLGTVHGVDIEGEDVGFYWVEVRQDILHLHGFILAEEHRGKGYGSRILAHIEEIYKTKVNTIELGVHEENTAAIRLYERSGYQKKAYLEDVGYHIMQKTLKNPAD